jgi:APA family basic amino acid/polyamine antiporter
MPSTQPAPAAPIALRRVLGGWDLIAIGINQVIGGAIFLIPSQVASHIGNWSPFAYIAGGLVTLLVAVCLAEVASRFDRTGGTYVYVRAAFGRFVGFEVGWMQWFTRASSQASVVSGIAMALAYYWPAASAGLTRALIVVAITVGLAILNVRGARQGAVVIDVLTVAKLAPLVIFLAAGTAVAAWPSLLPLPPLTMSDAAAAALIMVFAFGGFDTLTAVAGESRNPRSDVPRALIVTVLLVTAVMGLVQVVTMGALADVGSAVTPVADAAFALMGWIGALLIGAGSIVSMLGNNAGGTFNGSRILYALAEDGDLPPALARVHPVYHTPAAAIWAHSLVVLALALTGSFAVLATASALARLVTYTGGTAAMLALRGERFRGAVMPARFVAPGGSLIPVAATIASAALILGASRQQLLSGCAVLATGAAVRLLCRWRPAGASAAQR